MSCTTICARAGERGDADVLATMHELAHVAEQARAALLSHDVDEFGRLIDFNFELRRRIMPIQESHAQMIETARSCGASAHFTGSGGAITGVCADDAVYARLRDKLGALGCQVLRPDIGGVAG